MNITSVKNFTNLEVAKRLISDSWGVFKNITVLDVNDSNDSYLVDMNTNILHLIEKFSNHKGDKRTNSLNWLAGQFERHKAKCLELIQEDLWHYVKNVGGDAHLKSMDARKTQTDYYYELIEGEEHRRHTNAKNRWNRHTTPQKRPQPYRSKLDYR